MKFRMIETLDSTEMMYLQDRIEGEGRGYPGLDRCPLCLSNIQPPHDTGHGVLKYYFAKKQEIYKRIY